MRDVPRDRIGAWRVARDDGRVAELIDDDRGVTIAQANSADALLRMYTLTNGIKWITLVLSEYFAILIHKKAT